MMKNIIIYIPTLITIIKTIYQMIDIIKIRIHSMMMKTIKITRMMIYITIITTITYITVIIVIILIIKIKIKIMNCWNHKTLMSCI